MVAPLAGIRVLEVANWLAAPGAAAIMADMGADVIKVEPPGGEAYRYAADRAIPSAVKLQTTYAFELDNRGKRSITLDLAAHGSRSVATLRRIIRFVRSRREAIAEQRSPVVR